MPYQNLDNYTFSLPFVRSIVCPVCKKEHRINLENYITHEWSEPDITDNMMGPDHNVEIDTGDQVACDQCGCKFHITGWLREYPLGALDQDHIQCTFSYQGNILL